MRRRDAAIVGRTQTMVKNDPAASAVRSHFPADLTALRAYFVDNMGGSGAAGNSAREKLAIGIISGLYNGRFRPGQRLIESQLTKEFGLSRGPVREALNRLAAVGVVNLTLQSGASIRKLSIKEAIDIFVVSNGLVKIAACLAASQIDATKARMLEDALSYFLQCSRSINQAGYALSKNNFFATILRISGNVELPRVLPGFQTHLVRVQFGWMLEPADQHSAADYKKIAKAIVAGKPSAAENACQAHFERVILALKRAEASGITDGMA